MALWLCGARLFSAFSGAVRRAWHGNTFGVPSPLRRVSRELAKFKEAARMQQASLTFPYGLTLLHLSTLVECREGVLFLICLDGSSSNTVGPRSPI
mmetsp:Transcript_25756/g.72950  ORF Transcript_25756/g.72950 Transcript_25756/m.72950 type:complete len:96 (-) Transcript_25756:291-578(-)